MTPPERAEFQAQITDAIERFGWWAVLWECSQMLRAAWEPAILKHDKQTAAAVAKAAGHCQDAADAMKGEMGP